MSAAVKMKKKRMPTNQETLESELDYRLKRLLNTKSKHQEYRHKKEAIKALKKERFKTPYNYKWWRDFRDTEVKLLFGKDGKNFKCPKCGNRVNKGRGINITLQHTWHPDPLPVLAARYIDTKSFNRGLENFLNHYDRYISEELLRRWRWRMKHTGNSNEAWLDAIEKWAYSVAKGTAALAWLAPPEALYEHISQVRRHIQMHSKDYKYICSSCAFKEDRHIVKTGKLLPDAVYFLRDEQCPWRDKVAQPVAERVAEKMWS